MKPKEIDLLRFNQILSDAFSNNALEMNGNSIELNFAPKCDQPFAVVLFSWYATGKRKYMTLWTRCRKCKACLKARQWFWTQRIRNEVGAWPRTWFGTLTVNPDARARLCYAASVLPASRGNDDDYRKLCKALGREITLFIKRLRKNNKARFRYFLVFEKHKDGFPHVHLLLHEWSPISKRALEAEWRIGFTKFKLVKEMAMALYVAKYLTKSAGTRVRASGRYGTPLGQVLKLASKRDNMPAWHDPSSKQIEKGLFYGNEVSAGF